MDDIKRYKSQNEINIPIVRNYKDLYILLQRPMNFEDGSEAYIHSEGIIREDWPNAHLCFLKYTADNKIRDWLWLLSPDEKKGMCIFDFKPEYTV